MRSRVTMVLAVMAVLLGAGMLVPAAYARLASGSGSGAPVVPRANTPAPEPPPPPTLAPAPVTVKVEGYFSWALLDRRTGTISGSKNLTSTNSTESMIKVWIVSDYLRRLGETAPPATRLTQASTAIRDSNDNSAQALYQAGGKTKVLQRLIQMCGLTETSISTKPGYEGWWSFTQMSPRDAVRMGDCVANGTAAGPKWTKWVLTEMSKVRGSIKNQQEKQGGGRWGIIDGLPKSVVAQGPVSIKNGWTPLYYDNNWHVNCLAVTDRWALAVMLRYPIRRGLGYGSRICATVATQLVTPQPGAALKVPTTAAGGA